MNSEPHQAKKKLTGNGYFGAIFSPVCNQDKSKVLLTNILAKLNC
jgi:hypothetical protein